MDQLVDDLEFVRCMDELFADGRDLELQEHPEGGSSANSSAMLADVLQSDAVHDQAPHQPAGAPSAKPRARRRVQLRPNVEIAQLREKVTDMEAHVAQLRKFYRPATAVGTRRLRTPTHVATDTADAADKPHAAASATTSMWFQAAVDAYASLQRSKQRNKQLREAINQHLQDATALQQLLRLKLSAEDMAFLAEVEAQQSARRRCDAFADASMAFPAEIAQLLLDIEQLYRCTTAVFAQIAAAQNAESFFVTSHMADDPTFGLAHELTTHAVVVWNVSRVDQFLWQQIQHVARIECGTPRECHESSSGMKTPLTPTLDDCHVMFEFREVVGDRSMRSHFAVQRFVEPQRVVLTVAARSQFSGTDLVIREAAWIVLTDAAASSAPSSNHARSTRIQTHYRIYTERQDREASADVAALQAFVLNFRHDMMRANKVGVLQLLRSVKDPNGQPSKQLQQHQTLGFDCITCAFQASAAATTAKRRRTSCHIGCTGGIA